MTAFSVRRAVVLVAALCMALLGLLGSAPLVSASPDKPSDQQTGLSEFGSCLSGGGKGSLVMLMDQSGSLQKTDPDKARVTAAQYLAARLASFSTTKGITLDVRVAGFASSYAGAGDWTSLTPDALETVKSQISAVGDDIKDYDTDYWNALEGARQDLVDHDTSGCRAVAWLSDGEDDLEGDSPGTRLDQRGYRLHLHETDRGRRRDERRDERRGCMRRCVLADGRLLSGFRH